MRSNKKDAEFYKTAFNLMIQTCIKDYPQFKPEKNLKEIILLSTGVTWRQEVSEKLLEKIQQIGYCEDIRILD